MTNLGSIQWVIMSLCLLHCALVASTVCNSDVYGTPSKWDCNGALAQIPYAYPPRPNPMSQWPRIFAEPQYMSPPFGQVDNYVVEPVSQPDRVFRFGPQWARPDQKPVADITGSCRIAIMSKGRPAQQGVAASQFTTTWKNIVDQSQQFRSCFGRGASSQAQGGYVPLNRKPCPLPSPPRPTNPRILAPSISSGQPMYHNLVPGGHEGAAMYMYSSDSIWNTVAMNTYMSSGVPAVPYTHPNQLGLSHNTSSPNQLYSLSNASLAIGTSSQEPSIPLKPLAPGELVIQDRM
ncbi:hypothetical protein BDR22DRAFT_827330 [Usnea florida]